MSPHYLDVRELAAAAVHLPPADFIHGHPGRGRLRPPRSLRKLPARPPTTPALPAAPVPPVRQSTSIRTISRKGTTS